MFDTVSERMPRTIRRALDASDIRAIDGLVRSLDRAGANCRTRLQDAGNDNTSIVMTGRPRRVYAHAA